MKKPIKPIKPTYFSHYKYYIRINSNGKLSFTLDRNQANTPHGYLSLNKRRLNEILSFCKNFEDYEISYTHYSDESSDKYTTVDVWKMDNDFIARNNEYQKQLEKYNKEMEKYKEEIKNKRVEQLLKEIEEKQLELKKYEKAD